MSTSAPDRYALLTAEALAECHARYDARMTALADSIARHNGVTDPASTRLIRDILDARSRLGPLDKLGTGDIGATARDGTAALNVLLAEETEKRLFTPKQEEAVMTAAAARDSLPHIDALFGGADRIYFPIPDDFVSETRADVARWLTTLGYDIHDYAQGHAKHQNDGHIIRIGKLMHRHAAEDWLRSEFENDPTRNKNLLVAITRNTWDQARNSTGRAWQNCLSSHNIKFHQLPRDIEQNALSAYVISADDPDITRPLARLRLLPYVRGEGLRGLFNRGSSRTPDTLYMAGPPVGLAHPAFQQIIDDFCVQKLHAGRNGTYYLRSGVFADSLPQAVRKEGPHVSAAWGGL